MRIVLAHKYFYRGGGTATYLLQLIPELQKRGHECIPFTVAYDQTVPSEYSSYFVTPVAGTSETHLRDMRTTPWLAVKLLARATWSQEAYRKALALCDDVKPDIAYVHNLYSYMSPSPIAAFSRRGRPVVMRISDSALFCPGLRAELQGRVCIHCATHGPWRGLRYRCHKGSLASTAARAFTMAVHRRLGVHDRVSEFVAPSRFMAELFAAGGYAGRPMTWIPSFFPAPADMDGRTEDDYVLYFGRVSRGKGLETLIRAFAEVAEGQRLVIAGADVDGETARLRGVAIGTDHVRVEFVGPQERDRLDRLIARSLFTVVPSEWCENSPMSILEAFAHAKPVVASELGGIPELIAPGTGFLFPPGDAQALSDRLGRLLSDTQLRHRAGHAAWQHVRTEFSAERHCERLERVFASALGTSQAGRSA